jgi:hypothetical protein
VRERKGSNISCAMVIVVEGEGGVASVCLTCMCTSCLVYSMQ